MQWDGLTYWFFDPLPAENKNKKQNFQCGVPSRHHRHQVCVCASVLIIINHCAIVCHTRVQDSPVLVSSYPPKKVSEFPLPAPAKPAPLPNLTAPSLFTMVWSLTLSHQHKQTRRLLWWVAVVFVKIFQVQVHCCCCFFSGWIHWGGKKKNLLRARRVNPNLLENSGAVRRRGRKCLFVWCKFDILENLLAKII